MVSGTGGMPRLDATNRPSIASSAARANKRPSRRKKAPPTQDRLSQRTLLWRRVKRSIRPGLWILGVGAVLVVGGELLRSLPASPPAPAKAPPAVVANTTPVATPVQSTPVVQPGLLAEMLARIGFKIHNIEIHGAEADTSAAVLAALDVKDGDPIFGFSLKAMLQRVDALGPVQSAVIERQLPGTLVVNVKERDIYAIWQTIVNGQPVFQIIDHEGNVITGQSAVQAKRREPSLLLLSGAGAPQLANVLIPELKSVPAVMSHVAAAERVDDLRWNLILKNHTVVKLPAEHEQAALSELAALQTSIQLLDRPVESIDLRQPGRLVVHPYVIAPASRDKHAGSQGAVRQEGQ